MDYRDLTEQERSWLRDQLRDLARAFARPAGSQEDRAGGREEMLARLRVLGIMQAELEQAAAAEALSASEDGANFRELGDAWGITRQAARKRWPRPRTESVPRMASAPLRPVRRCRRRPSRGRGQPTTSRGDGGPRRAGRGTSPGPAGPCWSPRAWTACTAPSPASSSCRCGCSGAAATAPSTWASRSCCGPCTRPCWGRRPAPATSPAGWTATRWSACGRTCTCPRACGGPGRKGTRSCGPRPTPPRCRSACRSACR